MVYQILFGQGEELMSFVRGYGLLRVSTFQAGPSLYFYKDQSIPTPGNKVYLPYPGPPITMEDLITFEA